MSFRLMQVRLMTGSPNIANLTIPNQPPTNKILRGYKLRYELRTHLKNEFVVKMQ